MEEQEDGCGIGASLAIAPAKGAGRAAPLVVCSLVLCSVDDPDAVLRQLNSVLKPGGELRYFEHIASTGWRGGLQRLADFTVWPRIAGNCHTHRHTERTISGAGFTVEAARHQWTFPAWVPLPVSEIALGRAVKNA
jgi:SAM-dependent methyltransferase